jgi:hypothetical protein
VVGDRPAHDGAAEDVQDRGAVDLALGGLVPSGPRNTPGERCA